MKHFAKVIGTCALAATLCIAGVGCGEPEDPNAPVTIDFWYGYTGAVDTANKALVDEFNETVGKEKNITVVATPQPSVTDTANQLSTAIQGGTQPDVVALDTAYLYRFLEDGALESLDGFAEADKDTYDLDDFYEGFMRDAYYDGELYSVPFLKSTPVLYVNKDLLTQAGLTTDDLATWDGFFDACSTVHTETGMLGTISFTWMWLYNSIMLSYGTSVFNDEMTKTNIASDASKNIINNYLDLKEEGAASLIVSENHLTTIVGGFTQKKMCMFFYSTGGLTTIQSYAQKAGIELAVCPMPKGTQQATVSGGANLVVPVGNSNREKSAAWEFIKFMTSKENTIELSTATGYLPTRESATSDAVMTEFYSKNPAFKVAADQLPYVKGKTVPDGEASNSVLDALDAIWVSGADVDTTLADAAKKVEDLLK